MHRSSRPSQGAHSDYSATSDLDVVRGYSRPHGRHTDDRYGAPSAARAHGWGEDYGDYGDDEDDEDGYEGRHGYGHEYGGRQRRLRMSHGDEDYY